MLLWTYLLLLTAHWLGDFVLQTHWQSQNKSKRLDALAYHVGTYTITLSAMVIALFGLTQSVLAFIAVNAVLHFTTDFFTSRITSRLYREQRQHDFFVVVGFDQLIHQVTLAVTLAAMMRYS